MKSNNTIRRLAVLAYGSACYAMFLAVFLYALGFVGNIGVPKSLDSPRQGPLTTALFVNTLLLGLFAVQHSVMARPAFKRWWTRLVPEPIERSTYVLFSNVALILLFWLWQPMGGVVWHIENGAARMLVQALFVCGCAMVLYATYLINHFDLFGMRQVWLYFKGVEYTPVEFRVPGPYRFVRHPLYVGWLTVFWSAPTMTTAHLLFAVATTAYILVAIRFEERDLVEALPGYAEYRGRVPMLIPSPGKTVPPSSPSPAESGSH